MILYQICGKLILQIINRPPRASTPESIQENKNPYTCNLNFNRRPHAFTPESIQHDPRKHWFHRNRWTVLRFLSPVHYNRPIICLDRKLSESDPVLPFSGELSAAAVRSPHRSRFKNEAADRTQDRGLSRSPYVISLFLSLTVLYRRASAVQQRF